MRLRVRTLGPEECEVSVNPDETIRDLKKKIELQLPRMQTDRQKLVHAGRVLEDRMLIKSYPQLKENERLVVLVTKQVASSSTAAAAHTPAATAAATTTPAAAKAAASTPGSSADQQTAAATTATAAVAPADAGAAAAAPDASTQPASTEQQQQEQQQQQPVSAVLNESAATLATGEQLGESIRTLEEMGFPSAAVRVALRAAFNNPDRAVEYLMNGIPEDLLQQSAAEGLASTHSTNPPSNPPPSDLSAAGSPETNPLAGLRSHPVFAQVRQLTQANPQMLPQVLQMIGASNPELLQLITQNQEAFLELLREGAPAAGDAPARGAAPSSPSPLLQGGVVQLTEEEMAAVDRLTALGFTRMQVAEAFIACDRNEELAANYLFENMNDFADEDAQEEPPAS